MQLTSVAVESSAVGNFFRIEAGRSEWTVSTTVGAAGVVDVPAALFSRLILAISSSSETCRAVVGGRRSG